LPGSFAEVIDHKRILVCVGSGGVGKTTTAAALAIQAAQRGRKTLVLTIDPAKRLADSLGLEGLGHEPRRVDPERLDAVDPRPARGELWAMMLDQKAAFDEMVESYASDPAAVQRIFKNPVYQQVSGTLAGSQEYAALAKLQSYQQDDRFDLIVVDTPPTANALDFLDAPRKLSQAIDSPAIEWFRKMQSGGGWSMVGRSGTYILKKLAKFVGSQFLDDLALFFTEFNDILGGFKVRAEEVFKLLKQDFVSFILVTSPERGALAEALYFHERLIATQMPFAGFVVNKVHQDHPLDMLPGQLVQALQGAPAVQKLGLQDTSLRMAAESLLEAHADLQVLAHADRASIDRLKPTGAENIVEIPFFKEDIHEVEALATLQSYLFPE
jgi:anion-transporting  ArsA/GET3 family ATPase